MYIHAVMLLVVLASLPAPALALTQDLVASLALPTTARPTSLALTQDGQTLLIGTRQRSMADEFYAIALGPEGVEPVVEWSLDIGAHVHAIALAGTMTYLATADDTAELVVVDLDQRRRVAAFDAEGPGDGRHVEVLANGDIVLRRQPSILGPEWYRLTFEDGSLRLLEAGEDTRRIRAPRPPRLCCYRAPRGQVIARARRRIPAGALHYLLVTDRPALQVVEERAPVVFADIDGDGIYRLGCLGDSNTARARFMLKWCELLHAILQDPQFEIVNLAVNGATVTESPRPQAAAQMAEALAAGVDAVVLAFGTNDLFLGRSAVEVRDAYLALQSQAEAAGLAFYVATTPPTAHGPGLEVEVNQLLRDSLAPRLVDFDTGFGPEHFVGDGFHFNQAGQYLRAERALEVLRRPDP